MMKVTKEDLTNVLALSRLRVEETEVQDYVKELNAVLLYMDNLSALDTTNEEPTVYPLPMENVFRADEVRPGLSQELALANAPQKEDGYFKVPRVLEE